MTELSEHPIEVERRVGHFVCMACRDDPSENCTCDDETGRYELIPPVWLDYWPECGCCKRHMHLLEVLAAVSR